MFSYQEAVEYIEELPKFTKKHPLHHTREYVRRLGNPGMDKKIIHVAGTNGKGSVCAYIQAILMQEGKRTGFFTSPHLVCLNERICVDNEQISDESFTEIFNKAVIVARQMEQEGSGHPSYFEFLFGMGMLAFEQRDVEYIVLETGLGGRLDCTNCLERPVLDIITSISLDHTAILGDTIEKIAGEKAGIIKENIPVFFDGSDKNVSKVIREKAEEMHAPCREITKNAFEIREVDRKYIAFSRCSAYDKSVIFRVPFCGYYQVMNAELALEAAEYLLKDEAHFMEQWPDAIASIHWEGRMEQIAEHIMIDGAHNPGAIQAFVESIRLLEEKEKPVIVFSAVADKKYEQMIEYLCENLSACAYIVTEIKDDRRVPVGELASVFEKYTDKKVICCKELSDALKAAEKERREGGMIYCLGSLYLVGMLKKYWKKEATEDAEF